jgi:hypothetical protein
VYPVGQWFNFKQRKQYKTLTLDEAEESVDLCQMVSYFIDFQQKAQNRQMDDEEVYKYKGRRGTKA